GPPGVRRGGPPGEKADHRHRGGLLRAGERRPHCHAAEKRDELAPLDVEHSVCSVPAVARTSAAILPHTDLPPSGRQVLESDLNHPELPYAQAGSLLVLLAAGEDAPQRRHQAIELDRLGVELVASGG